MAVIDPKSGEILAAEIFVATLGASKYAYAEGTWTQTLPDWIGSNIRMLEFFAAVPSLWIPYNLKAAIKKAGRYEPGGNLNLRGLYSALRRSNLPARSYHVKDKAAVEMSGSWCSDGSSRASATASSSRCVNSTPRSPNFLSI